MKENLSIEEVISYWSVPDDPVFYRNLVLYRVGSKLSDIAFLP
jgi:hypothetical protein